MRSEFSKRLESAVNRGKQRAEKKALESLRQELSEEQLRDLHATHRLSLCETIESAVHGVADHFPGFRQESIFDSEIGWGDACFRNDLRMEDGKRTTQFSRFEIVIRPFSDLRVLDMKGKGTVFNREVLNRSHYVLVQDVELSEFEQMIETWTLEFAEVFAAKS